jgi:hypothetical protein
VEPSETRCFSDREYAAAGATLTADLTSCDIILGIKEVPIQKLIPEKKFLFFSHTKKAQAYNQELFRAMIEQKITLVDYECLEHEDGQRLLGFGFFAGVVGAHNGMMAYGNRSGLYSLERVYKQRSFRDLIHTYFGLKLPRLKIAVTGSGRVAHGILEIMNLMGIHEVSRPITFPDDSPIRFTPNLKAAICIDIKRMVDTIGFIFMSIPLNMIAFIFLTVSRPTY